MLISIERSDSFSYKVMNLEVWALVETLDRVFPGAWNQFMTNRQVAVKQFLQRHRDPNWTVDAREKEEGREAASTVQDVTGRREKEEE